LVRERRQVVIPGGVGFGEEGHRIVETNDLSGLVNSPHVILGRAGDDSLPDLPLEGLVGVCGSGKLHLEPVMGGLPLSLGLLVDIEGALVERVVRSFDVPDSVVGLIELVSAGLVKLPEVLLGLFMLVYDGSYPAGRARDLDDRLRRNGSVGDLETGRRVLQTEYVNIS
jgi:hypothetical protein